MKTNPDTNSQDSHKPVKALTNVLGQTTAVKGLVDEAAQGLSSVNADLKQELEVRQPPGVEKALEKSETIEYIVRDAADKLTIVNAALKDEVHERHALEVQLAAATEREEVSRHASVHDALTGMPIARCSMIGWSMVWRRLNDTTGVWPSCSLTWMGSRKSTTHMGTTQVIAS